MPEYLAPGVYVEETSFRAKTIEGVSTSTAGFVGPARFGPTKGVPELLTSFADFERIYGGLDQLEYSGNKMHNYLAHAVRAFFENGGKRLYVSRAYKQGTGDGRASSVITKTGTSNTVTLKARYPGDAGNMTVTFVFRVGQNILSNDAGYPILRVANDYDVVLVKDLNSPIMSPPGEGTFYWLKRDFDTTEKRFTFKLNRPGATAITLDKNYQNIDEVRIITVTVSIQGPGKDSLPRTWENLSLHPLHRNSLSSVFAAEPVDRSTALYIPLVFEHGTNDGASIAEILTSQISLDKDNAVILDGLKSSTDEDLVDPTKRTLLEKMTGGSDGVRPSASDYEGAEHRLLKSGLKAFEDIEDISIVAAPGATYNYGVDYKKDAATITSHVISHCERMRYRIAVLDSPDNQLVSDIRSFRGKLDSKHAALYYPWVKILDPVTGDETDMPPSGFVAGIYARNDVLYGVHKAPANEVVNLAIGFEHLLNKAQQDVLNPEAINCFRFFEGRGYRLWGARTITSDPEWKYVNLRRYFAYLERSIEKGTQWVVFENNSEPLWANVRQTVEDFLYNEWKSNHLMGTDAQAAYFVRCDRTTMTQNDIDNGRLICLVGVAPVRPAEFVIFRIGQWTASKQG